MKRLHSEAADAAPVDVAALAERRIAIVGRLEAINGPILPSGYVSSVVKSDVHWDHVMQEMVSHSDGFTTASSRTALSHYTEGSRLDFMTSQILMEL